jgi:hypothetical protein
MVQGAHALTYATYHGALSLHLIASDALELFKVQGKWGL